jgi:two-component system sensor kinase FixL
MSVSFSGFLEPRPAMPGAPPSRHPLHAWVLKRLDSFLTKAQRQARQDDLRRYRVIVAAAGLLILLSLIFLAGSLAAAHPFRIGLSIGCLIGYASTLVLVRTSTRLGPPALMLCMTLASAYIWAGLQLGNANSGGHVASTLIPLLAFFLMGARGGLAFAVLMSLYALVLQPLYVAHFDLTRPEVTDNLVIMNNLFAATCILGVWGLSYMHSRARDDAQAALVRMMQSMQEGERKLSSVLESTDDIVCSLDAQGNLLTANAAMRKWFLRIFSHELRLGKPIALPAFLRKHPGWPQGFAQVLRGEPVREEVVYSVGDQILALDFNLTAIPGEDGWPIGVTIFGRDVTARREAEARLSELHRSMVDVSRRAGMAEIATGVLHNVGNTLNSVNVSATLVAERLRGSRMAGLVRATELLHANSAHLSTFLTQDEKGRVLPEYLLSVSRQLAREQERMLTEVQALTKNVEHIKSVVSMQQEHARFAGLVEQVTVCELIDDALRLHATSFERLGIQVRREYAPVPPVLVDRHRLLQILVNLLSNARHALLEGGRPDKQLTLRIAARNEQRLCIEVADNGIGIPAENLSRIFTQGFTTKRNGHGFGLHASALAASEMKGSLTCTSNGLDQGATFTIDLPLNREHAPS